MACSGNPAQICGGLSSNSVYKTIIKPLFNLYGYNIGNSFYDAGNDTSYNISKIMIYSNFSINAIQLEFSNGINSYTSSLHGDNSKGTLYNFIIPNQEYIFFIYVCYGTTLINRNSIIQLQFITNMGTSSLIYGAKSGGICFNVNLPGGLFAIGGYSDNYLNGIYFNSTNLTTTSKFV